MGCFSILDIEITMYIIILTMLIKLTLLTGGVMKNKRRERTIRDFLEAAREIIETEGVNGISARKIGEVSGYSYATLYNYFKDIDHLLVRLALGYLEECCNKMENSKDKMLSSTEQIIQYAITYFEYFETQPKIFELVFLKCFGSAMEEVVESSDEVSVSSMLMETLEIAEEEGVIKKGEAGFIGEILTALVHGKMLFYITGRHSITREQLMMQLGREIQFIMEG